jgi:NADH:ubiquinone reductase (H+-translocating)
VPGYPHVFVIGDAAAAPLVEAGGTNSRQASDTPQYVPGLAAAANQMGEHAARMVMRLAQRQSTVPFRYRDKGVMAVIGRGRAVASLGRLKLTGALAFYSWALVHLLYLAGFRNRLSVMIEWAHAYFTYRPGARLLTREDVLLDEPSQHVTAGLRYTSRP